MRGLYYHPHEDDFSNFEVFAVLGIIIGLWWGLIHLLDWLTFDAIVWWAEPLTFFILLPYLFLWVQYGGNPLHWWPLVWGTKISNDENTFMAIWRAEETWQKYGGALNVYYNKDYIKFRKKRDAFEYCLLKQRLS